jgi:transcription elongation factor GreA
MSQQNITKEGFEKLKKQLEELKKEQAENLVAIKDARSQGDLSENADYASARENQSRIVSRIKETENEIKNAVIITGDEGNNLTKVITIRFLSDSVEQTYQLVGSIEADPLQQKMSDASPLGQAVLHAKKGDEVLVKTEDGAAFKVKVVDIKEPKSSKKSTKKSK